MKLELKRNFIFFNIVIIALSMIGCGKVKSTELIDEFGLTQDNISEWSLEICYINETRGTGDKIFTTIGGDSNEFIEILNSIYAADIADKPNYIFSAEAMCEYKIDFFHTDKETPMMTFYYLQGNNNNMLTYVTKTLDKDNKIYVDYSFFTPYGDLPTMLQKHRDNAYVPKDELAISFVSRIEMMSSILDSELSYFVPEAELEDNEKQNTDIQFEFYEDAIPDDKSTNAQIYSNRTVPGLSSDEYLLVAKKINDAGIPEELSITEVRYNDYYTLVFVTYPNIDFLTDMGLTPNSAITIFKEELPLDRRIVLLDEDDNVIDIIDPERELQ